MENDLLVQFWDIYGKYIKNGNKDLRTKLSQLLGQIENKDRTQQLLRPEKGWSRILAWQVLRTEQFIYPRNNFPFTLYEGEILAWTPCWDRDVFLTRIPYQEQVSGYILRPGYYLECDQKEMSDHEWTEFVKVHTFSNEIGLYLPLFEFETVKKFAFDYIDKAKDNIVSYLKEKVENPHK